MEKKIKDLEWEVQSLQMEIRELNKTTRFNSIAIIIVALSLIITSLVNL